MSKKLSFPVLILAILFCRQAFAHQLPPYTAFGKESQLAGAALNNRPNIILIVADDMGWGDAQCFNPHSKIPTPAIDRLAAEGMLFLNAHASASVCTPSRYSLMTGKYPWRSRLKTGVLWTYDRPLIESSDTTIGEVLQQAGYTTAIIGKWHLGWIWPQKKNEGAGAGTTGGAERRGPLKEKNIDFSQQLQGGPLSCGFGYQFGIDIPSLPPFAFIENGWVGGPEDPEGTALNKGYTQQGWKDENMMPALLEKSLDFIDSSAKKTKPFFLYLPLTAPHTPIVPNERYLGKSRAGDYGDFVVEVDDFVGTLRGKLAATGIADNTVIVFTSDNGAVNAAGDARRRDADWAKFGSLIRLFGHDSNRGLRGMKGDIYEGGHRIPLIISWPALGRGSAKSSALVSLTDLFATFIEISENPLTGRSRKNKNPARRHAARDRGSAAKKNGPAASPSPQPVSDGRSLLPLLTGTQTTGRESLVVQSSLGCLALVTPEWKYIDCSGDGGNLNYSFRPDEKEYETPGQLYDLRSDPEEKKNLYNARPEIVEQLARVLEATRQIKN